MSAEKKQRLVSKLARPFTVTFTSRTLPSRWASSRDPLQMDTLGIINGIIDEGSELLHCESFNVIWPSILKPFVFRLAESNFIRRNPGPTQS